MDLFFILSGFILTHVYGHTFVGQRVTRPDYARFLYARFARIYPLHLFMLTMWVLLDLAKSGLAEITGHVARQPFATEATSVKAIVSNVFLLQGMHLHHELTWNGPSWSISTEWWVYLLFPFLVTTIYLASPIYRAAIAASSLALLYGLAFVVTTPGLGALDVTVDYGFVRCACEFFLGVLAYRLYASGALRDGLSRDRIFVLATLWIVLVMQFQLHDLWVIPGFVTLILAAAENRQLATRVLNTYPAILLGEMSYSIYMCHTFVREIVSLVYVQFMGRRMDGEPMLPGGSATLVLLVALVLVVSFCTWRLVERPSREYLRRFVAERRGASVVQARS